MTTYVTMQDRIADEAASVSTAAASIYETQIKRAIQSAIRHYERRPFYFNEVRSTFTTSSSAEYYTTSDFAFLDKIVEIYTARITVSGSNYLLEEKDWDWIDAAQSTVGPFVTGDPTHFAYFGKQLRLFPVPTAARTIVVSHIEKAVTLSVTSDTNYWMTDAEELIRARATADFKINVRRLAEAKSEMTMLAARGEPFLSMLEKIAFEALAGETESRNMTGHIVPTEF